MIIEEAIKKVRSINWHDADTCVEFWEPIGLLTGIDDEDTRKKVSQEFTKLAKYLFYTDGAYMNSIYICTFPTVRKIFTCGKQVNKDYSPKALCEQLQQVLKECANNLELEDFKIDIEAQACSVVSDFFIQNDEI